MKYRSNGGWLYTPIVNPELCIEPCISGAGTGGVKAPGSFTGDLLKSEV